VTGVVFQGQGEPLHNYDSVVRAAAILSHPCGGSITGRAITVSTVGVVPGILRMARENYPWRLIVSMTSAIEEKRRELIPTGAKWSVEEIAEAAKATNAKGSDSPSPGYCSAASITAPTGSSARPFVPRRTVALQHHRRQRPPDGFRRDGSRATRSVTRCGRWVPGGARYSGGFGKHAACGMLAAVRGA
jgi:23S rRNA (adenine2503-C2)-methyltransferase